MRSKYLKFFFFIIPLFILTSCSDDPSSVGLNNVGSDLVNVKDYDSQSDTVQQTSSISRKVTYLGSSSRLLLGKISAEGLNSKILFTFSFGLPDSIHTDINNGLVTVKKAYMNLVTTYKYPNNSVSGFNFTAHRINTLWYPYGFTIDSMSFAQTDDKNIASNISFTNDSVMYFELDQSTIFNLLHSEADTGYSVKNYGIMLKPGSDGRILGFASVTSTSGYEPTLSIILEKTTGNTYLDTVVVYPYADVHVIEGDIPSNLNQNEYIAVRGGVTVQSTITFDLSKLPSNAIINHADLILTPDYSKSTICDTNNVSLYATCISTDSATQAMLTNYYQKVIYKDGDYYKGDITYFVQRWMKTADNFGMTVEQADNVDGVDLFVFKGSKAANVMQRPRLKIIYSIKK